MKNTKPKLLKTEEQSPKHVSRNLENAGIELSRSEVEKMIEEAKIEVLEKARSESRDEINKQVQTDKASLITVFGIFASITSFLTIEFQFLKTLCTIEQIIGFTFILLASLLSFTIALDYLVKSRLDKETPKANTYFCILVFLLFMFGIIFTSAKLWGTYCK